MRENAVSYTHLDVYKRQAMGNLYSSFIDCLMAQKEGKFDESMIDYPTIEDGVDGVLYISSCLKSQENGNIWVNFEE